MKDAKEKKVLKLLQYVKCTKKNRKQGNRGDMQKIHETLFKARGKGYPGSFFRKKKPKKKDRYGLGECGYQI